MSKETDDLKHEFLKQNIYLLFNRKIYPSGWRPKSLSKKDIQSVFEDTVKMIDDMKAEIAELKTEIKQLEKELAG